MNTYKEKFQERLDAYTRDFQVDQLNNSNDQAQLHMLISAELMLRSLQEEIERIVGEENLVEKASDIKKLSDLIRDTTNSTMAIQKTLGIDRKTRKNEETDSVAGYIRSLKREAKNFLDERMLRLYCPTCKVMTGRFSAVHKHTKFKVSVECSQCGKMTQAHREGKDVWFDLGKDAAWRKQYPVEIILPSNKEGFTSSDFTAELDDEVIIDGDKIDDIS